MKDQTAQLAFQELNKAGLLESEHLNVRQHLRYGLGTLRTAIENGHHGLTPNGAEEKQYLQVVEHLTRPQMLELGQLLEQYYFKNL